MTYNARNIFYIFDEPVKYKNLTIYPVRIRDYLVYSAVVSCLLLEKNSIKDPIEAVRAISMSYLEYMYSIADKENLLLQYFVGLLALVLGRKDDPDFGMEYGQDENGKAFFKIGNSIYNSEDFDNLREIIAEQNSLDLPDERIQKDVRESMEEARRFKEKISGSKTASFEEQIMALALYSGWDLDKVYEMTLRKFFMAVKRANHMIMSNIYLTASMSGFVTFKDKSILKGWLSNLEVDDKYGDVTMSLDSIKKKVDFSEAKEK